MRKILSTLACAAVLGAAPVVGQDVNPAGEYEFETMVEGQAVGGTMHIEGSDGAWTGLILAEGMPEIPVTGVEVDGALVIIVAEIPDAGELIIEVEFEGDEFAGTWALGFDGGELVGRKTG